MFHTIAKLRSKHKGGIGAFIDNIIGVFQGGPISARLFIIYDDTAMGKYTKTINKIKIKQFFFKKRDYPAENEWAAHQLRLQNHNDKVGKKYNSN